MHDNINPYFHRLEKHLIAPFEFCKKELFENRMVQKYLFLNQFQLHNIYQVCLSEDFETDRVEELIAKSDAQQPIRRKLSMMKRISKGRSNTKRLSAVVIEENEEFLEP